MESEVPVTEFFSIHASSWIITYNRVWSEVIWASFKCVYILVVMLCLVGHSILKMKGESGHGQPCYLCLYLLIEVQSNYYETQAMNILTVLPFLKHACPREIKLLVWF